MMFDLDPSRDDDLASVVVGALAIKESLDRLELPAYVKSTGSRGLHIVTPLDGSQDFDAVRSFARGVAEAIVRGDPERFTLEQRKEKREDRVFIDVNRNGYAQTAVAAFSVRARAGAPVSVPLYWKELRTKQFRPDQFNIRNVFRRIESVEDPWKDWNRHPVSLKRR